MHLSVSLHHCTSVRAFLNVHAPPSFVSMTDGAAAVLTICRMEARSGTPSSPLANGLHAYTGKFFFEMKPCGGYLVGGTLCGPLGPRNSTVSGPSQHMPKHTNT